MSSPSNPSPIVRARHRRTAWKIIAWTGGSIVALLLFIVATIAILLNNRRFHDYLQRYAEQQASDTLGVRVQLQNFALNLAHLDLDVYGLSIDGAAPYANPPLLQVDHVEVGVRVVSFLQRKWYLDTVRVDRPIVHLFVDANGNSNLPKLQSSGKGEGNNTDIFDLAIRQALVDRGEVYYNDRKSALAADMHDLDFQAAFNPQLQQYSGRIQYSNGHLVSGTLHTIPHSLDARFDATRTTFHLNQAALSTGPSQLILNATVQNYANPLVDARYDASLDGAQIGQLLDNPSVPTGQLRATGSVHYQQADGRSALDSLIVNGDLSSRQLNLRSASLRTQLNNLEGHYSLANSTATLHDLRMNLLGGQLIAAGEMANIGGDSHSKVNADLRSISLADLSRLSGSASSRTVAVSGALNAKLDASWGKTIQDLVAHADATINGNVARPVATAKVSAATVDKASATAAASIPIDGVIHATYTGNGQQIALKDSYIRTPQTSITMNGTVSKQSSLALRLQADDLREIETVADTFRTPAPALGLAGTASFEGTVTGSTTAPHLAGQLTASNLQVSGTSWKSLRTSVELSPSLISLQHGELNAASRGRITFGGSAELAKWSFTGNTPLQLQLNVSQIDVAEFTKFSPQPVPVTGTVTANIAIHGSELNPVGNGTVSLANLVAYDQPITSAKVTFSGTGSDAQAQLAVQLPSGNIQGNVSVKPQQKTYTAQVTVTGVQLQKLQALSVRNIDATGELSLKASGQGSFDNPQFYADLQIPQLVVQHQSITGLNLQLNVANHVGNADLSTSAVNTHIQAKAQVQLTGDYLADATIDTQAIPFAPLIAVYAPEQAGSVTGQTELHATLHGPLKNKHLLEAHLTIPTLKVAYGSKIQLAAANPIHMDYKNGVVELQRASIVGTDTNLQLQGSIPVDAPNAQMSVMLLGSVDLQLAQLFDPDIQTSGQIKLNVNSSGLANSSNIGGEVQIVDASYSSADLPVGLQHANGVLTVSRDRIDISKFQGRVGGGTLTARGGVTLQPQMQFDVGLTADGIRMLYPQGLRESVNANVRLAGNTDCGHARTARSTSPIFRSRPPSIWIASLASSAASPLRPRPASARTCSSTSPCIRPTTSRSPAAPSASTARPTCRCAAPLPNPSSSAASISTAGISSSTATASS
jgi:translocation and assembly module TamB